LLAGTFGMERNSDREPRTADEIREREEQSGPESTVGSERRHPNDPIGDTAYGGDMMLPPTGNLYDPPPTSGLSGEPPHSEGEDEEPR
jgi:hypothetical protein